MNYSELITKLSKMNYKNRINYIKSKVEKAIKSNNKDTQLIYEMMLYECDDAFCYYCPGEDIGYCGFRLDNIDINELRLKYCFPSFLKYLERR
jgi:hypothetical protein